MILKTHLFFWNAPANDINIVRGCVSKKKVRFFQIQHDESGDGSALLCNKTAVFLGTWHVYKMASLLIWRLAGPELTGPLFHALFPSTTWFATPSLLVVSRLLSLMRQAYGVRGVRDELKAVIADPMVKGVSRAHAENIWFFMEWLLPKV